MKTSRKNSKQRSRKFKKVAKRLATYSAAAAATLMTTQNRSANAAEVVWDIPDIGMSTASTGVAFHMVSGATTYDRDVFGPDPNVDGGFGVGWWIWCGMVDLVWDGGFGVGWWIWCGMVDFAVFPPRRGGLDKLGRTSRVTRTIATSGIRLKCRPSPSPDG